VRPTAILLLMAMLVFAQQSRDGYRSAYRAWRTTEPTLERDAAGSNATLGARADQASAAAAKYFAEKKTFQDARSSALTQYSKSIEGFTPSAENDAQQKDVSAYLNLQSRTVLANIAAFGTDPDKGIQQLREATEREQKALNDLTQAVAGTGSNADKLAEAAVKAEQARARFVDGFNALASSYMKSAEGSTAQAKSWAAYYRTFSEIASGTYRPPVQQTTEVRTAGPGATAASAPPPRPANASEGSNSSTARPAAMIPLSRYVGEWEFMRPGSAFLGIEPDNAELEVREDKGQISGTLSVRYRVPSGFQANPVTRFEFSGAIQANKVQTFPLLTSDRSKGTIDLIPGPAVNLIEVNFDADPVDGKIHQGNFILLKK
jgi:hypothetical protein